LRLCVDAIGCLEVSLQRALFKTGLVSLELQLTCNSQTRGMAQANIKIMLYSHNMNSPREFWPRWAETLRRYRLHELTAMLLEAGSPLALLGAQVLYFSRGLIVNDQLTALAFTLEEDNEARAFASFLMEERASW
jgi:hypothetical protein